MSNKTKYEVKGFIVPLLDLDETNVGFLGTPVILVYSYCFSLCFCYEMNIVLFPFRL